MNICLIPARKGSKRIKNKNIKIFNGKPIIYYSIKAALKSKLFDKIIVTTDSVKIRKIAIEAGAEVPFLRPKKFGQVLLAKQQLCFSLGALTSAAKGFLATPFCLTFF